MLCSCFKFVSHRLLCSVVGRDESFRQEVCSYPGVHAVMLLKETQRLMCRFFLVQVFCRLRINNFPNCATRYLSHQAQVFVQDGTGITRGLGSWTIFVPYRSASRPADFDIDVELLRDRAHDSYLLIPVLRHRMVGVPQCGKPLLHSQSAT